MAFNRHDVMKLADAIYGAYNDSNDAAERAGVRETSERIGSLLQDEIPEFDKDAFMDACGVNRLW